MAIKIIAVSQINKAIARSVEIKLEATVSSLWHSVVHNNISFLKDMDRSHLAHFDTVLRQLIAARWNKETGQYGMDFKKAEKTAEKLGLDLDIIKSEWRIAVAEKDTDAKQAIQDKFIKACEDYYNAKVKEKLTQDLDTDNFKEQALKSIRSNVKKAIKNGASPNDVIQALVEGGFDLNGALTLDKVEELADQNIEQAA